MKLFELVNLTNKAFRREDETHLAYLIGYRIDVNTFLRNKKVRYNGFFLRSLIFLKRLALEVNFKNRNTTKTDFLIFTSTDNQLRSLLPTAKSLRASKKNLCLIYSPGVTCTESRSIGDNEYISFKPQEISVALLFFLVRSLSLYYKLLNQGNVVGVNKYFDRFCGAYLYVPYFLNILNTNKPYYAIIANDHSIENRCLKLAAEMLNIKTVFMQHGSGSEFLPPLEFDYAFLDGSVSVEKYIECNKSINKTKRNLEVDRTTIFKSGLKKKATCRKETDSDLVIGFAVNPYDDLGKVEVMLKTFLKKGVKCIVRAHPAQDYADIAKLDELESCYEKLSSSLFKEEPVNLFLSGCSLLIAGNSGIHLEAAIAHVPTYYFEFGATGLPRDYYRHVNEGIAKEFPAEFGALSIDDLYQLTVIDKESSEATRRFSESFGTWWEGKEGELVTRTLIMLKDRKPLSDIYYLAEENQGFKAIYGLRNKL